MLPRDRIATVLDAGEHSLKLDATLLVVGSLEKVVHRVLRADSITTANGDLGKVIARGREAGVGRGELELHLGR